MKSESGPIPPKTVPVTAGADRKELRRIRGELINEKSRTLGPLQTKIDDIENKIIRLEETMDMDNSSLLEASQTGDSEGIKKLSKAIHDSKSMIDSLFSKLELINEELETKTKEFEERFRSVTEQ